MKSTVTRLPKPARWLAVAVLGALTGAALHLTVGGPGAASEVSLVAADPPSATAERAAPPVESESASSLSPAASAPLAPPRASVPAAEQPSEAVAGPEPAPAAPAVAPAPSPSGLTLRIPALGIDAPVVTLGFTGDGQLDVPDDGSSVGWYDISPRPGEPGNALLGAHFDWDGSLAVFASLSQLSTGDLVYVADGSAEELVYEVSDARSVGWDHPVSDVLATGDGGSSLTLFTCGGSFDSDRSEYDERLIVRAVQIDASTPLAARR